MSKKAVSVHANDFAQSFGTDEVEIKKFCGTLIPNLDLRYEVCSLEERETVYLDVIKKCDQSQLSISGAHRIADWRKGWGEIVREFRDTDGSLEVLIPKDWRHGDRPLRYMGNYIKACSKTFEPDYTRVFRYWLYQKYFTSYKNIYEFGCGTGQNLVLMAQLLPEKKLFGMDWVPESQELLSLIAEKYRWPLSGHNFDFFYPDYKLKILPESVIYTSSALEQIGSDFRPFLDYLFQQKPALCINVECMSEYYDENKLFDYVALRYHRSRNYLNGFLTRLRELEKEGKIEIIASRRTGFGSLYHEGLMYVIWKIK